MPSLAAEQLLDFRDGLGVVLVKDRMDARVPRTGHAQLDVIEEDHFPGEDVQACADQA